MESLPDANKLIPTQELIRLALSEGLFLGNGDPQNYVRYLTKVGLLPPARRLAYGGSYTVGHYPLSALTTLREINAYVRAGWTIQQIVTQKTQANLDIPTTELINRARLQGIYLGSGDPYNYLRYLTKLGILPNATRQAVPGSASTVGHYPVTVVETLREVEQKLRSGMTIQQIAAEYNQGSWFVQDAYRSEPIKPAVIEHQFGEPPASTPTKTSANSTQVAASTPHHFPRLTISKTVVIGATVMVLMLIAALSIPIYLTGRGAGDVADQVLQTLNVIPPREGTLDAQTSYKQEADQNLGIKQLQDATQSLADQSQANHDLALDAQNAAHAPITALNTDADNSIENSSYELNNSGSPQAWDYLGLSTAANTYVSQDYAHTDKNSLRLDLGSLSSGGIIQHQTTTRSNGQNALSVWVKGSNLSYGGYVRLGFKDSSGFYSSRQDFYIGGNSDWQRLTLTANGTGLTPALEVKGYRSGTLYLDDWQLTGGSVQLQYAQHNELGQGALVADGYGNFQPAVDKRGNLGSPTNRFSALFLAAATIDNKGNMTIGGSVTASGSAEIKGDLTLDGGIKPITDNQQDLGTPTNRFRNVYATSLTTGGGTTNGDQTITGNLTVNGSGTFGNGLTVNTGSTTLAGVLNANGGIVTNGASINAGAGAISTTGSITGATLTTSGNTSIGGTLVVSGATTVNNTLTVTGTSTLADLITSGQIKLTGNAADRLLIQPSVDPVAGTNLFTVKNAAGTTTELSVTNDGKLTTQSLHVINASTLDGAVTVGGLFTLNANFTQTGNTTFSTGSGAVSLNGNTAVTGSNSLTVGSGVTPGGLTVNGAATFNNGITTNNTNINAGTGTISAGAFSGGSFAGTTLTTTGNASVGGTLGVTGATTLSNTLAVTGVTTLTGQLNANGGIVTNNANISAGTGSISGGAITGTTLTTTGNASVGGTLGVTGATTLSNNLSVTGNTSLSTVSTSGLATLNSASVTGNETVGGTLGVTGTSTLGALNAGQSTFTANNATYVVTINQQGTGDINDFQQAGVTKLVIDNTGNLVPAINNTETVGTAAKYFNNGYFTNLNVNNLSATTTNISGTTSSTFTLDTGNSTNDTQNQSLIFFRGTATPNALLTWNSTTKQFELNFGLLASSNLTDHVALIAKGASGQTADLFEAQNSSGTPLVSISSAGNLSVTGTATVTGLLTANGGIQTNGANIAVGSGNITGATLTTTGNVSVGGTLSVTGNSSLSTLSTSGLAALNSLSVANNGSIGGTLSVTGATTLTGQLNANGGIVTNGANINVGTGTVTAGNVTASSTVQGAAITDTALTAGSVVFAGTGGALSQNNSKFFWDNTNLTLNVVGAGVFSGSVGPGSCGVLCITGTSAPNAGQSGALFDISGNHTPNQAGVNVYDVQVLGGTVNTTNSGNINYGGIFYSAANLTKVGTNSIPTTFGIGTAMPNIGTSNVGLFVGSNVYGSGLPSSGNFALYSASTNNSYFAGNVGVGTTTPGSAVQINGGAAIGYSTSTAAPTNGLQVAGTSVLNGSTNAIGPGVATSSFDILKVSGSSSGDGTNLRTIQSNATVNGNVTGTYYGMSVQDTVNAPSSTIAQRAGLFVAAPTVTAGTLTNNAGIIIGGQTGATNNIDLLIGGTSNPAGTYSIYDTSTSANVLNGNTRIGSSVAPTVTLDVTGAANVSTNLTTPIVYGSGVASGSLTLTGTSNLTKGEVLLPDAKSTTTALVFGGDANADLYNSAISTLKTDGSFIVGSNLTVNGGSTLLGNTSISGTLGVTGATTLSNTLTVSGATQINSTLGVTGAATFSSTGTFTGTLTGNGGTTTNSLTVTTATNPASTVVLVQNTNASPTGNLLQLQAGATPTNKFVVDASGNTTVTGTLGVTGATTLSTLSTSGAATLNSLAVTNNATVGGTFGVTGVTTLSGLLNANGGINVNGNAVINTSGSIGIGTTTPQVALNLAANDSFAINMTTPSSLSGSFATGGTLTLGQTYFWVVTALDGNGGETVVSNEINKTPTISGTQAVILSWTAVQGAGSYKIYRGTTSGAENTYFTATTNTFTDTGAAGTAGTPPTVTTAYVDKVAATGNTYFLGGNVGVGTGSPGSLLTVNGTLTAQGVTTLNNNVILGASSANQVTFNALVSSNIIPSAGSAYDLGSTGNHWRQAYIDTLNVTTNNATGTTSNSYTINQSNSTNDTQDSFLYFHRGTATPDAYLKWNSTLKQLETNFATQIGGNFTVTGNTTLSGTVNVNGAETVAASWSQTGTNTFSTGTGAVSLNGNTSVVGTATFSVGTGATTLGGTLGVTGAATFSSTGTFSGLLTANGGVNTNSIVATTAVNPTNSVVLIQNTNASPTGNLLQLQSGATPTNKFVVDAAGNVTVAGTLGVTGATTLSTLSTSGAATLNSLGVTNNATVGGTLGVTGATTLSSTTTINGQLNSQAIIPQSNIAYNLGSLTNYFATEYLDTLNVNTINSGATNLGKTTITANTTDYALEVNQQGTGDIARFQKAGVTKVTVDNGGNLSTVAGSAITSGGTLTASNGFTQTTGALSLTASSGSAALTLTPATSAFNINSGTFDIDTQNSRVGIGTVTPHTNLEIFKSGSASPPALDAGTGLVVNTGGSPGNFGSISVISGATGTSSLFLGSTNGEFEGAVRYNNSTNALSLATVGTTRLTIDQNGNTGIGTSAPSYKLDVNGTARVQSSTLSVLDSVNAEGTTTNLVANPSMEAWTGSIPTSWTTSGANVTTSQVTGHFGSYAVRFSSTVGGNTSTNRLTENPGLSINTTYTISYYARRVTGTGALQIAIDNSSANIATFTDTTGNWVRVSQTITTSSTSAGSINFYPSVANDTFDIDDVQVEQSATLTSFTLSARNANTITTGVLNSLSSAGSYFLGNVGFGTTTTGSAVTLANNSSIGWVNNAGTTINVAKLDSANNLSFRNNSGGNLYLGTVDASTRDYLQTGGVGRVLVDSTGNVGIGAVDTSLTSPKNTLDVGGSLSIGSYAGVNAAPSNGLIVSGNVGIGTSAPVVKLDVYDPVGTGSTIRAYDLSGRNLQLVTNNNFVGGDTAVGISGNSSYNLALRTGLSGDNTYLSLTARGYITFNVQNGTNTPTERMRIDPFGNVGIGNSNPGTTLDVTGTGRFSSTLTASNGFTQTTGALNLTSTSGSINATGLSSLTASTNGAINLTAGSASNFVVATNTANAFRFYEGSNTYQAIDSRTTTQGVSAITLSGASPTLTAGSTATYTSLNIAPQQISFSGNGVVTSQEDSVLLSAATFGDATGLATLNNVSSFTIAGAPTKTSGSINIANGYAFKINAGAVTANSYTNAYSLYVDAPTGATNNYSIYSASGNNYFAGATTFNSNITNNGAFLAANGTAASPSYSFANSTGTGIYLPTTNVLGLSTNGAERLRVDSSGNVGIGTTSLVSGGGLTIAPAAFTSGSPSLLTITAPADTTLTASEFNDINFNLARTVQFTGSATPGAANITTQRAALIQAPTYSFSSTGAQTITNAATLAISGAPIAGTNATITNPYALWVQGGNSYFQGNVTSTGTISQTGLTQGSVVFAGTNGVLSQNNSQFFWDNTNNRLGIGTTGPTTPLQVAGNIYNSGTTGTSIAFGNGVNGLIWDSTNGPMLNSTANLQLTLDSGNGSSTRYFTINKGANTFGGGTELLRVTEAGNLGIGTTSPQQSLTLASGDNLAINIATPAAPTVTPTGTAGTTSYSYTVTALDGAGGETIASTAGSTSTGNATLSSTNYNAISWTSVQGAASYNIYRTVGGVTQGKVGNTTTTSFSDTGLAASGSSPISTNAYLITTSTSGNLVLATGGGIQALGTNIFVGNGNSIGAGTSSASAIGYLNTVGGGANFANAVGSRNSINSAGVVGEAFGDQNTITARGDAFGQGNTANGNGSAFGIANTVTSGGGTQHNAAFGYGNTVSNDYASAFGYTNSAQGINSVAFGYQNTAYGTNDIAIGSGNTANGNNYGSIALGKSSSATGQSSTAIGWGASASNTNSTALGGSNASGASALAISNSGFVQASGSNSIAFGNTCINSSASNSVTIGSGDIPCSAGGDFLVNNVANSIMLGVNSPTPTVTITGALGPGTVGNVGIGTTSPVSGGGLTIAPLAVNSGTPSLETITGPADTGLTNSEFNDVNWNLARTVTFTGSATPGAANITTERAALIKAPTYAFGSTGAQTITNAATLAISGAPTAGTNATITNPYALWIQGGTSRFDGFLGLNGNPTGIGSINSGFYLGSSISSAGSNAAGLLLSPTLTASANNDRLVAEAISLGQSETIATNNLTVGEAGGLFVGANGFNKTGTGTVTTAYGVRIDAPTIGSTNYALWVNSGNSYFQGNVTSNGTISQSGLTQGSVVFAGSGGALSQNNGQFFWDNTNNRLGIGTSSPGAQLQISSGSASTVGEIIRATSSPTADLLQLQAVSSGVLAAFSSDGRLRIGTGDNGYGLDVVASSSLPFRAYRATSGSIADFQGTTGIILDVTNSSVNIGNSGNGGTLGITTGASAVGEIIQASSGQTADLQRWINYNGSQILASIGGTGNFTLAPSPSTSGTPGALETITGPSHTGLANAEASDINWNLARTVQFTGGASTSITNQRAALFQAPTYSAATAGLTITNAATLAITGAPIAGTNATITNPYALWVQGGSTLLGGATTSSGLLTASNGLTVTTGTVNASSSTVIADRLQVNWIGNSSSMPIFALQGNSRVDFSAPGIWMTNGSYTEYFGPGGAGGNGILSQDSSGYFNVNMYGSSGVKFIGGQVNTGSPTFLSVTPSANTTLTAAEAIDINFNLSHSVQFTGSATPGAANITTQRAALIQAPTYSFSSTGAQTITNAATLAISGAPIAGTNATITNPYALWVQGGQARFDGGLSGPAIWNFNGWNVNGYGLELLNNQNGSSANALLHLKNTGNANTTIFSEGTISTYSLQAGSAVTAPLVNGYGPANSIQGGNSLGALYITNNGNSGYGLAVGSTGVPFNVLSNGTSSATVVASIDGNGKLLINSPTSYTGLLTDLQLNNVSKFKVDYSGNATLVGQASLTGSAVITGGLQITGGIGPWGGKYFWVNPSNASINSETFVSEIDGPTFTLTGSLTNARTNYYGAPTYTSSTAQTVTNAATVTIAGAPIQAGSTTITNPYALWVQGGTSRFDGDVKFTGNLYPSADATYDIGNSTANLRWRSVALSGSINFTGTANQGGVSSNSVLLWNGTVNASGGGTGVFNTYGGTLAASSNNDALNILSVQSVTINSGTGLTGLSVKGLNADLSGFSKTGTGTVANSYAVYANAATLATNNYSIYSASGVNYFGGNVGIGTNTFGTNNKLLVNSYNTVDNLATVQFTTSAATNKGLVIQGSASQSADLFEAQNSAGAVLSSVTSSGLLRVTSGVEQFSGNGDFNIVNRAQGSAITFQSGDTTATTTAAIKFNNANGGQIGYIESNGNTLLGQVIAYSSAVDLVAHGVVGQTNDLQQWQDGNGIVLANVTKTGSFNITASASTSGSPSLLTITGPAHTGLSAAEVNDINFNLARTVTFGASGTITNQRAFLVQAPTYASSVATTTLTNAATLAITGAPTAGTNVAITNNYALWVQGGATLLAGTTISSGLLTASNGLTLSTGALNLTSTSGTSALTLSVSTNAFNIQSGLFKVDTQNSQIHVAGGFYLDGISTNQSFSLAFADTNPTNNIASIRKQGKGLVFVDTYGQIQYTFDMTNGTGGFTENMASGFTANLMDLQVNGASKFTVNSAGSLIQSSGLTIAPPARTSGSPSLLTVTAPADTGLSAAETNDINVNLARTVTFGSSGTITNERAFLVQAPTYASSVATTTLTNAATFAITGAPTAGTNVAITNPYALWVQGGMTELDGALTINSGTFETNDAINNGYGGIGRYENELVNSETFNGTGWTVTNVTVTKNVTGPNDVSNSATTLTSTVAGGNVKQAGTTVSTSNNFVGSIWVKTTSGTQNFDLRLDSGNVTGTVTTYTATTAWRRYWVAQTFNGASTGNATLLIFPGQVGGTGTVVAYGAQLEKTTNRIYTGNPGPYSRTTTAVVTETGGVISNGSLTTISEAASDVPLKILGYSGQTGNLLEVRDASGNLMSSVSSSGQFAVGSIPPTQAVTIQSGSNEAFNMAVPAAPTGTPSASGGSMATGTYFYVITALDGAGGETIAGTQSSSQAVTGPSGSVALTWSAIQGAASYKVYRTTTSGTYTTPSYIANPTANSYTDTALNTATGAPPTTTTAYVNKISSAGSSWINSGSLGIGTATPATKLDVAGVVNIASMLQFAGSNLAVGSFNDASYLTVRSNLAGPTGIHIYDNANTSRGYLYGDTNGVGILNPDGTWALRSTGSASAAYTEFSREIYPGSTSGGLQGTTYISANANPAGYGSIKVYGSNASYSGVYFASSAETLMVDTSGTIQGFYKDGVGWQWYWNNGTLTTGTVPAANVSAGTFGSGNYTMTGNLTVGSSSALVGAHPTYGSGYAAFWKNGSDYAILDDGSNTFVNAPSGAGTIYFRAGNTAWGNITSNYFQTLHLRPPCDQCYDIGEPTTRYFVVHASSFYGAYNAGPDVAEKYNSDNTVSAGDVVDQSTTNALHVAQTQTAYSTHIMGVISSNPGVVMSDQTGYSTNGSPVALVGRVPVKVSLENGSIAVGDPLTSSSTPGVAMKATKAARVIGYALESYTQPVQQSYGVYQHLIKPNTNPAPYQAVASTNGVGEIMVFIHVENWDPNSPVYTPNGTVTTASSTDPTFNSITAGVANLTTINTTTINLGSNKIFTDASGNLTLNGKVLVSGTLHVTGDLSLDGNVIAPNGLQLRLGSGKSFQVADATGSAKFSVNDQGSVSAAEVQVATSSATFTAGSTNGTTVTPDAFDFSGASIGTVTIKAGSKDLLIKTTKVHPGSKIFITFNGNYSPATRYWTDSVADGASFELHLDLPTTSDVSVNFWIVN